MHNNHRFRVYEGAMKTTAQRRGQKRVPCEPVAVQIQITGFAVVQAQVLNVSQSGLRLVGNKRLERGLEVSVKMDGLLISGHIRYCVENCDTAPFDLGLQIDEVTKVDSCAVPLLP
jgi:hypothetical protein